MPVLPPAPETSRTSADRCAGGEQCMSRGLLRLEIDADCLPRCNGNCDWSAAVEIGARGQQARGIEPSSVLASGNLTSHQNASACPRVATALVSQVIPGIKFAPNPADYLDLE